MQLLRKVLTWAGVIFICLFVVLFIMRWFHLHDEERTMVEVSKIHATKLQLSDVMGENLPKDPGADADKTIAGVDANDNGIRDDVELAIFKEYPKSAKTRAALLQYALALQMEFTQPFVNTTIATEVIREEDRAYACVGKVLVRKDDDKKVMEKYFKDEEALRSFVKKIQINTEDRDKAQENFYEYLRSYKSLPRSCDIDYSTLPN
jgi:chaperonin cofactor prefoldin